MKQFCVMLAILLLVTVAGCSVEATLGPEIEEPTTADRFSWNTDEFPGLSQLRVITDSETGREYLFYKVGDAAGLSPLLPAEQEVAEDINVPITEPEPDVPDTNVGDKVRYKLTDEERRLIEEVVMAEAGNQGFIGQALVATCILNSCDVDGLRPANVIEEYSYTPNRVSPSESVCEAVRAIFDDGYTFVDEPIVFFYAPAHGRSGFHESQKFVLEYKDHRFFALKED